MAMVGRRDLNGVTRTRTGDSVLGRAGAVRRQGRNPWKQAGLTWARWMTKPASCGLFAHPSSGGIDGASAASWLLGARGRSLGSVLVGRRARQLDHRATRHRGEPDGAT